MPAITAVRSRQEDIPKFKVNLGYLRGGRGSLKTQNKTKQLGLQDFPQFLSAPLLPPHPTPPLFPSLSVCPYCWPHPNLTPKVTQGSCTHPAPHQVLSLELTDVSRSLTPFQSYTHGSLTQESPLLCMHGQSFLKLGLQQTPGNKWGPRVPTSTAQFPPVKQWK